MAAQPDKKIWSVSQNDNFSYCQCPECLKVIEEEGSPAGPIIRFVNRVAALFPDKTISTLAYQYSRPAPRRTRPAPNVEVMLCTIELDRSRPIAEAPSSASFVRDIGDWSRDLLQPLSLGLHGQLLAPGLALPQPARARAQHPVLRRPRRPQALPADQHRPGARMERAQIVPAGPAALGPEDGRRRRDGRIPRRLLRPGRTSSPPLHRRPPRRARALRGGARHLRAAGGPRRGPSLGRRHGPVRQRCSTRPRPPWPAIPPRSPGSGRPACP